MEPIGLVPIFVTVPLATIPMALDPANDPLGTKGTIDVFVRRSYVGSKPTSKTFLQSMAVQVKFRYKLSELLIIIC